jgi:hypothetical protein
VSRQRKLRFPTDSMTFLTQRLSLPLYWSYLGSDAMAWTCCGWLSHDYRSFCHDVFPPAVKKRSRKIVADEESPSQQEQSMSPTASYSTTYSKRSRFSASPTKQINRLAAQQKPLEKHDFSQLHKSPLPAPIGALVTNIRRCAKGTHTIPLSLKSQVLERDLDLDADDNVWRPESPQGDNCVPTRPGAHTEPVPFSLPTNDIGHHHTHPRSDLPLLRAFDAMPDLLQVEMIVEQARECNDMDDLEAGWNSHVHGPLLVIACHLSRHHARVRSVNLTLARSLARLGPGDRLVTIGKMVDFGIYLQVSPELRAAYKAIKPEADGQSRYFNHTNFEQIARKPLVISVETKRDGQGGSQADLQLSVWVNGHFDRLADLRKTALNPSDRTVWLPLLKVIGPIRYLLMARGDYNDLGELLCTTVYTRHQLGDVTTYHGVFQVFSALQELIDWTETSYRPWFEGWVSASHNTNVPLS